MAKTFGQIMKIAREAKGLSYRETGKRLNVQHVVVYEVETGKRLPFKRIDRLEAVARELELDIEVLALKSIEGRNMLPLLKLGGKRLVDALDPSV
jgi:transcriptional regulator with XRE-family HTH domain|tara:strand:- start:2189 stop:2473 length:285 start_codon:yes stop_codon:yes gene_type:complete